MDTKERMLTTFQAGSPVAAILEAKDSGIWLDKPPTHNTFLPLREILSVYLSRFWHNSWQGGAGVDSFRGLEG